MNVAVFCESSADEAAVRTLLVPLVGDLVFSNELVPQLRSRGWPSVLKMLPPVIKHLHYQTEADGLVVAVDSDNSNPHRVHDAAGPADCRLCAVKGAIVRELSNLRDIPGRERLKAAVGLSMPSIEAWYLCGVDATVTEAACISGRDAGRLPYTTKQLKGRVYGTAMPLLDKQQEIAVSHAARLAADLSVLDTWFPNGCGVLLNAVRDW
jgi:hypothetical protein